jgi:hypothetical protein
MTQHGTLEEPFNRRATCLIYVPLTQQDLQSGELFSLDYRLSTVSLTLNLY